MSVLDLASMFDVDWMKGQSAGIFTLKNATPDDVIKELHAVFQEENQGKGLVRFQAINRLNAILAVTTKTKMLDEVETWVGRLDRGGSEGDNFYVYRVENGRAKDLAELLMAAFNGGGGTVRGAEESEVSPTESATRSTTTSMGSTGTARARSERRRGRHQRHAGRRNRHVEGLRRRRTSSPLRAASLVGIRRLVVRHRTGDRAGPHRPRRAQQQASHQGFGQGPAPDSQASCAAIDQPPLQVLSMPRSPR